MASQQHLAYCTALLTRQIQVFVEFKVPVGFVNRSFGEKVLLIADTIVETGAGQAFFLDLGARQE